MSAGIGFTFPTLAEAKKCYIGRTKQVLTKEARRDLETKGTWEIISGRPVYFGSYYAIEFRKDFEGRVWGQQVRAFNDAGRPILSL